MKLWKRIEGYGIRYIADQLAANKTQIVDEIKAALPAGEASLPAVNAALEQHVSPLLRPVVDSVLASVEAEVEHEADTATADIPAVLEKIIAKLAATADELLNA